MANALISLTGGFEALEAQNPSKRLGRPEDIAGLVVFLSSRAAGHINGANVVVDGGDVLKAGGMHDSMQSPESAKAKL